MKFLTKTECEGWLPQKGRELPSRTNSLVHRVDFPTEPYRIYGLARFLGDFFLKNEAALLWITEWGIWPSSENWPMYYRLRRSFEDNRALEEAPGHFFLQGETDDLVSFIQLSLLNGWEGYVLTETAGNLFFSHDEFLELFVDNEGALRELEAELTEWAL